MLAQSVEMPAGLSVREHPEHGEIIVYTLRGRWVLCVNGERNLMRPGSPLWPGEGASAGCEVPFDEPALVVNFVRIKGAGGRMRDPAFWAGGVSVVARKTS